MTNGVIGYAVKTAVVAGCAWCLENFEKEPVWCALFCGSASTLGIKVTYAAAKIAYIKYKPIVAAASLAAKGYLNTQKGECPLPYKYGNPY